ncbi:AGE family epimerase/isomerase [Lutimonas halocynthiae]|uniref:AGE family epimerase/isomerase n=1 Tax=Lutimonas halocynthiae TaxID=1446477 RepID=UPI0025B4987F|nr:AGE family epimerase/isomerase [Lutimonas halocynthiae]MDN3641768.1 AGE family epimerase/isomerase [Lutimonas halocynthiae]
MKQKKQNQLKTEFESYMGFWINNMLSQDQKIIFPEMSQDTVPNKLADMGSMYLSRIIYGASRAFQSMHNDRYRILADTAFDLLSDFKNPSGGYFWGRKYNMEWKHDADNVNMAQAFVMYGLAEYSKINSSPAVSELLEEQLAFIQANIKDVSSQCYLDGFDEKWARGVNMTRSFGSHFHIMEALVLLYEQKKTDSLRDSIRDLINIIIDRFIDKKNYSCLHRFTENWELLPDEVWAGHNAECSWVICEAAKAINDAALIKKAEDLAVKMMNQVIETASDNEHGGYFNALDGSKPLEEVKSWWPQAEVVLGLLNVFSITGEEKYKKLALEQSQYISKKFITGKGEWYTEIHKTGAPVKGTPVVFFWKSLYHTVRYYDYVLSYS